MKTHLSKDTQKILNSDADIINENETYLDESSDFYDTPSRGQENLIEFRINTRKLAKRIANNDKRSLERNIMKQHQQQLTRGEHCIRQEQQNLKDENENQQRFQNLEFTNLMKKIFILLINKQFCHQFQVRVSLIMIIYPHDQWFQYFLIKSIYLSPLNIWRFHNIIIKS